MIGIASVTAELERALKSLSTLSFFQTIVQHSYSQLRLQPNGL
jgi:hypothetical protein